MKISTRGKYALRFMMYAARHSNGNYITLKEIAENENISIKYLEQIVSILNKADLLISTRGSSGGYKLSRPAEKYTTLEILRVTEGDLLLSSQDEDGSKSMQWFWSGLQSAIEKYLSNITLQDLAEQDENNENFMYVI